MKDLKNRIDLLEFDLKKLEKRSGRRRTSRYRGRLAPCIAAC